MKGENSLDMDLTSLITTIITSVAALVAIVGGLLVSRVISLANDQHFYKRELEKLKTTRKNKNSRFNQKYEELKQEVINHFFCKNVLYRIAKGETFEELLRSHDIPVIDDGSSIDYDIKDLLLAHYNGRKIISEEVKKVCTSKGATFSFDTLTEKISSSEYFYDENKKFLYADFLTIHEALYKEENNASPESYTAKYESPTSIFYKDMSTVRVILPDYLETLISDTRALHHEIESSSAQEKELVSLSNDYLKTGGVWLGLGVLIFSSLIAIIYPSTLLPYPEDYYDDAKTKTLLITLFSIALFAIFGYIAGYLVQLTRNKPVKTSEN